MSLELTLIFIGIGAVIVALGLWRGNRSRDVGEVDLIPPGAIMFTGIIIIILMGAHLVSLFTGRTHKGRLGDMRPPAIEAPIAYHAGAGSSAPGEHSEDHSTASGPA